MRIKKLFRVGLAVCALFLSSLVFAGDEDALSDGKKRLLAFKNTCQLSCGE
jgi:hypothetical protein